MDGGTLQVVDYEVLRVSHTNGFGRADGVETCNL